MDPRWFYREKFMTSPGNDCSDLAELINQLDKDRSWILQQIDKGRWPELRLDLAALEREMGHLLTRASEKLEE
tara:strand:- start:4150 stop:4368 length:219 start_codon:yes stop_codon:yes gene_type:complete